MRWTPSTHSNIIFQLNSSRGVELNLLQSLTDDIVWPVLALLRCLDRGGFIEVSLVVDIKALEGVRERENLVLLKLRKLPKRSASVRQDTFSVEVTTEHFGSSGPLQLQHVHRRR